MIVATDSAHVKLGQGALEWRDTATKGAPVNFKNIAVAVDLDESTWATLEKVRHLALPKEAQVHLIHAFEISSVAYDYLTAYMPSETERKEIQQVVEKKMLALVPRLGLTEQSQVKVVCLVTNNARQDFLNYAEKHGCDLIVTASQEKTLMRGLFEGSFANYLNKYARASLMVLRPN